MLSNFWQGRVKRSVNPLLKTQQKTGGNCQNNHFRALEIDPREITP